MYQVSRSLPLRKQATHKSTVLSSAFSWLRSLFSQNLLTKENIPTGLIPVVSPRPSCPASFCPQPNTVPETDKAKVWAPPAVTWTRGTPDRAATGVGDGTTEVSGRVMRPSCPRALLPQVNACLSESNMYREQYKYFHCCISNNSRLNLVRWLDL